MLAGLLKLLLLLLLLLLPLLLRSLPPQLIPRLLLTKRLRGSFSRRCIGTQATDGRS